MTDFVCGALAGAAADMCLFPLDTIRARMVVMANPRAGLLREGLNLARSEGAGALYKGLGVHLLASVPSNGIFYSTYEAARTAVQVHAASGETDCQQVPGLRGLGSARALGCALPEHSEYYSKCPTHRDRANAAECDRRSAAGTEQTQECASRSRSPQACVSHPLR